MRDTEADAGEMAVKIDAIVQDARLAHLEEHVQALTEELNQVRNSVVTSMTVRTELETRLAQLMTRADLQEFSLSIKGWILASSAATIAILTMVQLALFIAFKS